MDAGGQGGGVGWVGDEMNEVWVGNDKVKVEIG